MALTSASRRNGRHFWSRARDMRIEEIVAPEVIERLTGKGYGANKIAHILKLPEERVRQVLAYYGHPTSRGEGIANRHVPPEEERASAESLALAPQIAAAAKEFREKKLQLMKDESPRLYYEMGEGRDPVPEKFLFPYGARY